MEGNHAGDRRLSGQQNALSSRRSSHETILSTRVRCSDRRFQEGGLILQRFIPHANFTPLLSFGRVFFFKLTVCAFVCTTARQRRSRE